MKKKLDKTLYKRQKKVYLALLILALIAFVLGILYFIFLKSEEKGTVYTELTSFFSSIKDQKIDYQAGLWNSIGSNLLYAILVWLLGISIIGIPFVLGALFLKSLTLGFSITSIISMHQWKGIPLAFAYTFPHQFLGLVLSIVLTFYSISFSWKLFQYLFLKREINFKKSLKRYSKVLLVSCFLFLITSLFEVYLAPYLLNLFL